MEAHFGGCSIPVVQKSICLSIYLRIYTVTELSLSCYWSIHSNMPDYVYQMEHGSLDVVASGWLFARPASKDKLFWCRSL